MAEFDEAMPSKETVRAQGLVRAVGLPTTAWFEFILDASRLEKHLNDPDAGLLINSNNYNQNFRSATENMFKAFCLCFSIKFVPPTLSFFLQRDQR